MPKNLRSLPDRLPGAGSIKRRLTKPYHPRTDGQAERMNRAIKTFHYPSARDLKAHVLAFITAYNFSRPLGAFRWWTFFRAVCDACTEESGIFQIHPEQARPFPGNFREPHGAEARGTRHR